LLAATPDGIRIAIERSLANTWRVAGSVRIATSRQRDAASKQDDNGEGDDEGAVAARNAGQVHFRESRSFQVAVDECTHLRSAPSKGGGT
jgi:hypothetical protein